MQPKRRNKGLGLSLLVVSVAAFAFYAYVLIFSGLGMIIIQATILAAVGIFLLVIGWIGYTILTAPKAKEMT